MKFIIAIIKEKTKKLKKQKGQRTKFEFSKFLALFTISLVLAVFLDFFYINYRIIKGDLYSYDFTGFVYAIPSVCTLATSTIIFYYNKAKLENAIKIKFEYIKNLLQLKKKMKLYDDYELKNQIDTYISNGEYKTDNEINIAEDNAAREIENNIFTGGQV